jgi:SAM-dependent methyltransferase
MGRETIMSITRESNSDQVALWNGLAARGWIEAREAIDRMFKPFEDLLVAAVPSGSRGPVLDVGCGTGATTLAVARTLEPNGRAIGIDISAPMIAVARARAAGARAEEEGAERERGRAEFILADAQDHPFEASSVETIVSRFGVMFFDDPARAFANLRRAAKAGGRLRFVAWRGAEENPFMRTAERAAAPLLPDLPVLRRPDAPGQFAFADAKRIRVILEENGWDGIDIRPLDIECTLSEEDLNHYLRLMGPVGRILQEVDARTRAEVFEAVRAAFDPFVHAGEVRYTAACWLVDART